MNPFLPHPICPDARLFHGAGTIRSMGVSELSSSEWAPADPNDPGGPTIGEVRAAACS